MKKKVEVERSVDESENRGDPRAPSWQRVAREMTEEELEKIRGMNWEWYYHCFLYFDEEIPISCKRCGHMNVFQPREKVRICENCGARCKRCEKEEIL